MLDACQARGFRLATAKSCTGGLIAACLTEIAGSSNVLERGYVTYDDRAKQEMLGVPLDLLQSVGAVSRQVALAMAEGARRGPASTLRSRSPGSPARAARRPPSRSASCTSRSRRRPPVAPERHVFTGDRSAVRRASLEAALALILRSFA